MSKYTKPTVFNAIKAMERIDELTAENEKLREEVERLQKERTNLEIRCRILEADRQTVAYICDGNSCGSDCSESGCTHTRSIEHAVNFTKIADGHYMEEIADNGK